MTRPLLPGLVFAALVSPSSLQAQPIAEPGAATQLPPVIVTTPRIEQPIAQVPAAIDLVTADTIQRGRQLLGLDESLNRVPGVFLQNRYNFAQDLRISIRGFGARAAFGIRGVKILVDGIPATLPDGQGGVDALDLGSAERIEVLRGPASVLYGNASGGVINIVTETGPLEPFLETRLAAGDPGYANQRLKWGGATGVFSYLLSASQLDVNGYREHSAGASGTVNAKLVARLPTGSDLTLIATHVNAPEAQDPGGLNLAEVTADRRQARQQNLTFNSGEDLELTRMGLSLEQSLGARHLVRLRAYGLGQDFNNRLPFESGGAVRFDRNFFGGGADYRYTGPWWGRPAEWVIGFDLEAQRDDRQRFDNLDGARGPLVFDQREEVTAWGGFLQARWDLWETLSLQGGIRSDRVRFDVEDHFLSDGDDSGDIDFDQVSGAIGLNWRLEPRIALFANLATGFETPTTTELADPEGAGFNEDLAAQTALNTEAGVRGAAGDFSYAAVVFRTRVQDELIPFERDDQPGRTFFRNAGESSRTGLEFTGTWQPARDLTITLSQTWSDFQFEEFDVDGEDFAGNALPGIPRQQGFLEVAYVPPGGLYAILDAQSVGSLYADNGNRTEVDAYQLANLRLGYVHRRAGWEMEGFFGVNNLFDEAYFGNIRINAFGERFYEPAPERNAYAGLRIRFHFGA